MSYMVRLKPDMVYDYLIIIESDKWWIIKYI
jgi:hypothetical protein